MNENAAKFTKAILITLIAIMGLVLFIFGLYKNEVGIAMFSVLIEFAIFAILEMITPPRKK